MWPKISFLLGVAGWAVGARVLALVAAHQDSRAVLATWPVQASAGTLLTLAATPAGEGETNSSSFAEM